MCLCVRACPRDGVWWGGERAREFYSVVGSEGRRRHGDCARCALQAVAPCWACSILMLDPWLTARCARSAPGDAGACLTRCGPLRQRAGDACACLTRCGPLRQRAGDAGACLTRCGPLRQRAGDAGACLTVAARCGSEPVTRALELMSKHGISGVPVVDENGRFHGIFSDKGGGQGPVLPPRIADMGSMACGRLPTWAAWRAADCRHGQRNA